MPSAQAVPWHLREHAWLQPVNQGRQSHCRKNLQLLLAAWSKTTTALLSKHWGRGTNLCDLQGLCYGTSKCPASTRHCLTAGILVRGLGKATETLMLFLNSSTVTCTCFPKSILQAFRKQWFAAIFSGKSLVDQCLFMKFFHCFNYLKNFTYLPGFCLDYILLYDEQKCIGLTETSHRNVLILCGLRKICCSS